MTTLSRLFASPRRGVVAPQDACTIRHRVL